MFLDELLVEFSHRRNRNEYLFEDNPEFYLYFGMFFLCALLIITWSYFECTDSESVTKRKKRKRKKDEKGSKMKSSSKNSTSSQKFRETL